MRYISLTFLFLLLAFRAESIAQWEILNEGFKGSIASIDFVDENIGWLAGAYGTLLKTTDGGKKWNDISIDESWNINDIDFVNESDGWAVGMASTQDSSYNFIIKSLDGGNTWQLQKQIQDVWLNKIYIIDENNVYTWGSERIYKTTDGGLNWEDISPNIPGYYSIKNSIWFKDSQNGVICGSYNNGTGQIGLILKTSDGGSSWNPTYISEFADIHNLQFLDDSTGYFAARKETIFYLCKTNDFFSSWEIIAQSESSFQDFQYVDSNLVYVLMDNYIMKSTDGGISWQTIKSVYRRLSSLFLFGNSLGYVSGQFLYRSEDLNKWEIQRFSYPLKDISFIKHDRGIIAGGRLLWHGSEGVILLTNNSGSSWDITTGPSPCLSSCIFLDEQVALSLAGGLFKTKDSLNNWTFLSFVDSTGEYFNGSDICFTDVNTGWVAGNYTKDESSGGGIMHTTDQGETWELSYADTSRMPLYSICFTGTTGWAVGEGGGMVKYTPQSGWVKKEPVTYLPLNKVFFTDENHGWISGGYYWDSTFKPGYLKTINGGESWEEKKLPYLINDFWFMDKNHGWAVGNDSLGKGIILESTDGGDSWTITVDNLIGALNSIDIKDNYAWAVGENGLVLRNTNAGVVWVEEENNNYPTEFILEQNYPNPFNPSTTIKYEIPGQARNNNSRVTLKVYDILGREIAALVDEHKPAGKYEIEFNAEKLTSGVYFYQLKAGEFVETRKMVLLK